MMIHGLYGEAHDEMLKSTRSKFIMIIAAAAMAVAISACAGKDRDDGAASVPTEPVAEKVAQEIDSTYFVDVEFQKGSTALSEQSRAAISALLNRAKAEGELNDVKVLAWADEEYPSVSRKKLSKSQRALATSRHRAIEKHVKAQNLGVGVDGLNMAERPTAVERWFNTPDARFKKSLVAAGIPTTAEAAPVTGRASHAVVLVTLK